MIQQDLQKFKKELTSDVRRKRSANNEKRIQQRLQAYQVRTNSICIKNYIFPRIIFAQRSTNTIDFSTNRHTNSATNRSSSGIWFDDIQLLTILIYTQASKEVSDNFEYIGKASLRQEITDAEYIKGFENMFLAWNKVRTESFARIKQSKYCLLQIISGYNKLSSKSKKELEKTFCIRVIVKGIMTKPLSVVQPILDKIAIEKAKAGMARDTIKLVTIEAYE